MVVWIGFLALSLTVWCQARIDVRLWGSVLTPGVVLMFGYAAISFIYAVASVIYEMADVGVYTYLFLIFASLMLIFVSLSVRHIFRYRRIAMYSGEVVTSKNFVLYAVISIAILYSILAVYISLSNGGLWSSEAKDALSSGLPAHIHVMLSFAIVYYSANTLDGERSRFFWLGVFLIVLSLYPVKGWILITLVAVFFSLRFKRLANLDVSKPNLFFPIISLVIGGVFVFFFIYLARVDLLNFDKDILLGTFIEIFQHFVFYLTASFAGLNSVIYGLRLPGDLEVIFAPVANIVHYLFGEEYIKVISNIYHESILGYQDGGNVFSYFGTLIGYLGLVGGVVFGILVIGLIYLFFGLAIFTKSKALFATSFYIVAVLSFGWFDYYFMLLTPYEVFLIGCFVLIVEFLTRHIKISRIAT